jgi:hypothetical protein
LIDLPPAGTVAAMAADEVNRDTVKVYVLDLEWHA